MFQSMSTSQYDLSVQSPTRFDGFTAINFPAMPETIELVRRADYNVSSPWGFPDGIHFYKGTSILEIPFSFKLRYDDRYCSEGSKTILKIAAALHSLVMPVGKDKQMVDYQVTESQPSSSEGDTKGRATGTTESSGYKIPDNVFPPVTCYLELIVTERDNVGIACVGYVKDVKVTLGGPFMRGQGVSRNLPSWGEFAFTFVHHPGHVNNYDPRKYVGTGEQQAYAGYVQKNLYNTVNLLTQPNNFVGIGQVQK